MIVVEDDALHVLLARSVPVIRVNAVDPVRGGLRVFPVNIDGVPVGGHSFPLQPHDCSYSVSGKTFPISRAVDCPALPRGSRGEISTLATLCVTGSQMTTPAVSSSEVQQFPMVESGNEMS